MKPLNTAALMAESSRVRTILTRIALLAALGLITLTGAGCLLVAAAGAAGGVVAYNSGDLEVDLEAGPQQTVDATRAAMQDLDLPILSAYATGLEGKVEARVGTDNKATIKVRGRSERVSHVIIRIGTFGDESMSQMILDKIKANLAAPAPEPDQEAAAE
jgi:hypothetical protein